MIGLIVTGHGNFGTGLTSSLKLIAGEPKDYVAVDFTIDLSTEQLEERLDAAMTSLEATCDGGILVLSDLGGGSPFKTAVMCSLKHQNVEVIAGTNLPMLLEVSMTREFASDVHSLAESALATGKDQVVKFDMASVNAQSNEPADDEDGIYELDKMTPQDFITSMLASAVVIVVMISVMALVMYFNSKKKVSKRKDEYVELHQNLKPNVKVEFASGFIGKLVRVGEETCDVEIAPKTVVTISRYSISRILDK